MDAAVERLADAPVGSTGGGVTPAAAKTASPQVGLESDACGSGVTQALGVFDLRGLGPQCLDFEFISFLVETIYRYC